MMNLIEQTILEELKQLPIEKQQEVLDFVQFLRQKPRKKSLTAKLKGLFKDLQINITKEEISPAFQ